MFPVLCPAFDSVCVLFNSQSSGFLKKGVHFRHLGLKKKVKIHFWLLDKPSDQNNVTDETFVHMSLQEMRHCSD